MAPMGYESALDTQMLAQRCIFCNKALRDPESIERGCGPDCAEKYRCHVGEGSPDYQVISKGLELAPEKLKGSVSDALGAGDHRSAVSKCIWHAAMASSYGGEHAADVIAAAQTIALGCGYYTTAGKIAEWHAADGRETPRRFTKSGSMLAIETPYDPRFVAAVKQVPGRRFEGSTKRWLVPEARMTEALNAMVSAWPGKLAINLDGQLFTIPEKPLPVAPPPAPPAPAPSAQTTEQVSRPRALGDLSLGDFVLDPEGVKREVGWTGARNAQDPRVGLRVPGQRGFVFYSFAEVSYLPKAEVAKIGDAAVAQMKADARAAGVALDVPATRPSQRRIPSEMFGYQVEGVRWLDTVGSGLLADEQGLGKSLESIVALDAPALVICPATLRTNWAREVGKWRPELSTQILSGKKPIAPSALTADVVIVNYDIVTAQMPSLLQNKWKTLIADEAHYIKELKRKWDPSKYAWHYSGSARAVGVATIAEKCDRKMLLTGTPILNRTKELWPLLHVLSPKAWPKFHEFALRYCGAFQDDLGHWDYSGSSNETELHEKIVGRYMLRRLKQEVLKDLPEKQRQSVEISLSEKEAAAYAHAAKDFLDWVEENGGPEAVEKTEKAKAIVKMTALRRLAAEGKLQGAIDWVVDHHESTGRPLVVMAHHRSVTIPLEAELRKRGLRTGTVLGEQSQASKQADIDAFQAGQLDVIVCSILAAGVGLTLTAAQEMMFVERAWRPSDLVQAEDRCHRIGQQNAVTITYLDGYNTIDGAMAAMLLGKVATIAGVVDGTALSEDEAVAAVMGQLFKRSARPNSRGRASAPVEVAYDWIDPTDV